jgi:hypothetical protein
MVNHAHNDVSLDPMTASSSNQQYILPFYFENELSTMRPVNCPPAADLHNRPDIL